MSPLVEDDRLNQDNDSVEFESSSDTFRSSRYNVKATRGDHDVPQDFYIPVNRLNYRSQDQVATAWALGFYPKEKTKTVTNRRFGRTTENEITVRNLYSSDNFEGEQNADGSGRLMHYSTRECIRTKSGLIINNAQCWSAGFAQCSTPPSDFIDYNMPLSAIEHMAEDQDKRVDLQSLTDDNVLYYESGQEMLLKFDDFVIMVASDSSSLDFPPTFVAYIEIDLIEKHEADTVQKVFDRVLKPETVKDAEQDGLVVRDSSEYTQTQFVGASDEVAERENLKFEGTTSYTDKDVYSNPRAYLPTLQGECIVRQGEYFFIPTTLPDNAGDFCTADVAGMDVERGIEFDQGLFEYNDRLTGGSILGSHNPSSTKATLDGKLYVKGTVRHDTNDHNMINLGDTWHRVVTHNIPSLSVDSGTRNRGSRAD